MQSHCTKTTDSMQSADDSSPQRVLCNRRLGDRDAANSYYWSYIVDRRRRGRTMLHFGACPAAAAERSRHPASQTYSNEHLPLPSASYLTTLWRYTNLFIIIIITSQLNSTQLNRELRTQVSDTSKSASSLYTIINEQHLSSWLSTELGYGSHVFKRPKIIINVNNVDNKR